MSMTTDEKFELLIEALMAKQQESTNALTPDTIRELLQGQATAMQKALKPENAQAPLISSLSYPEGDTARPRDQILKHEFYWNHFPVHKFPEAHHYRELELAALVKEGEFRTVRRDGSDMAVKVTADKNAKGETTAIRVEFPVTRDDKSLVPPMLVVLRQLAYPGEPRKQFVEGMAEYFNFVMGDEAVPA
jgi:hypothetical protein